MPRAPWELTREMFLTPAEVDRLLRHVRGVATSGSTEPAAALDRVVIELLLFSGVRCSECCRLAVADLRGAGPHATLRVRDGDGGRTVWLPRDVAALLQRYLRRVRPRLLRRAAADPGTLLLNERGRPFDRTTLYRRVVRILTAAGFAARASVQLLRHTYGYLAYLRTGGNLLFVQRQLGHAHPMVTSIYAAFVPDSYAALADAVAGDGRRDLPSPRTRRRIGHVAATRD
jgi:site-specific recombinase XerD